MVNVVMVVAVVELEVAVEEVAVEVVVVLVVVLDTVVVVLEHFRPHIAGHCFSANSWCSPPTVQSPVGIRVPHDTGSDTPWQRCGAYVVVVVAVVAVAVVVVVLTVVVSREMPKFGNFIAQLPLTQPAFTLSRTNKDPVATVLGVHEPPYVGPHTFV